MRAVLGIDAAWTATQPSGVALAEETAAGWRLVAAATSYAGFRALGEGGAAAEAKPAGETPDPDALLAACRRLIGREPDLIAVDMPLSRERITGRRASDDLISRAYGAKKCAVHTPSEKRPGPISDGLREGLCGKDYHLWTKPDENASDRLAPGLVEVYPHPALVELTGAPERLKYKIGKTSQYWPGVELTERRRRVFAIWADIVAALAGQISGVAAALPALDKSSAAAPKPHELKAHEDALDAVVCAWVGICVLEGRARAYGDADSAVWVPLPTAPKS